MTEKKENKKPYDFGRLFFPGESIPIVSSVRFQPLDNHVGNVCELAKRWKTDDLPCDSSLSRVLKAAEIHDEGKPQRFSIKVGTDSNKRFVNYIYSFKGHRFLAECDDDWSQSLARGHHDFSVGDLTRDAYRLRKNTAYANILDQNPLAYAEELYVLEMCDQIEAELACRVIDDEKQAESRTFMDYTLSRSKNGVYLLDPWPFENSKITLTFEYWNKLLTEDEKDRLQKECDHKTEENLGNVLDRIVKDWWNSLKEPLELTEIRATLKPAYSEGAQTFSCDRLYNDIGKFEPNPMQRSVAEAIATSESTALLVKGPTGSGKTEAILFPALARGDHLFLPLPARSLLEDQKNRVEKYLLDFSAMPENKDREISLVVDTGSQMYRWVYKAGKDITQDLSINLRRHLYKGDVILTTIDKFLYRYFSFGDKQKSFVFPLRINSRKTLICFDEAHSYDDISFTNFQSLVRSLYEAGRSIVLMTATMPKQLQESFDYLEVIDYVDEPKNVQALQEFQSVHMKRPYLNQRAFSWKEETLRDSDHPEDFQMALSGIVAQESKEKPARRILAVVQTVKDAAAIYEQLRQSVDNLFLYHGRIADQERLSVYQRIKQRDENKQPYVLITTSAIEVGCDLNSETLISQICPPENLIQRAGRCNRRGDVSDAKIVLVGATIPDFVNSLDEASWIRYQTVLRNLQAFDSKVIGDCISRTQQIHDYRVVEIFSMLHDYVYSADLTCKPSYEKGLVITRSWTPSATLIYDDGKHGDWESNFAALPKASIPLDRLSIKKVDGVAINQYANVDIYERIYDKEDTRWKFVPLRWGCAYEKDIVIRVGAVCEGVQMGIEAEYEYQPDIGFVELPGLFIPLRNSGDKLETKLLYKPNETSNASQSIITFIRPLEEF